MIIQNCMRLSNEIKAELEWKYLVNETLSGEKCIVPLLQKIVRKPQVKGKLREMVLRQIDEEVEHVRLYYSLVGKDSLVSSGFDRELSVYVDSLPYVSLQLFALQGMLEGIALGALEHRIRNWQQFPSFDTDRRAYLEEKEHVRFSFNLFSDLIKNEGFVCEFEFNKVSKEVNQFFVKAFSGEAISKNIFDNFSKQVDSNLIEKSFGLSCFRKNSAKTLVAAKRDFLNHYLSEPSLSCREVRIQ